MLPTGIILLWYGSLGSIPTGYVICDGNNGTPDLRNKFIVGAGDTYAVDETGGTVEHLHTFIAQPHTHTFPGGGLINGGANFSATTTEIYVNGSSFNADNLPPFHALAYIMKT